jgi:AraC-like DNA-binding protein
MARNGVDADRVFEDVGLDPSKLADPRARYRVEDARRGWHEAARLIGDPCFGLQAVEEWRATDFHALGYAFLASRTLRTGLGRIVRYNAIVDSIVCFELTAAEGRVMFAYRVEDPRIPDTAALEDARLGTVFGMCREVYGPELELVEVFITHPEPPCKADYYGLFRCPVHFNASVSQLVFDAAVMEVRLPASNKELAQANDAVLAAYVGELSTGDIESRVKGAVLDHLPSGAPSAETIAKSLHLSPRTLQRRLAVAGTSYSQVLEDVRRTLAEQYVADSSRSLSEITYLLGFSELSAFSRAFRRWTGQAPSAVRGDSAL